MNQARPNSQAQNPEETLFLLARLDPPVGLNDRIHSRLRLAQTEKAEASRTKAGFWSLWKPIWISVRPLQFAGATALVTAVAVSTWGIYHHPAHQAKGPLLASPTSLPDSFGAAKAEGHPKTLTPIKVPAVPRKKPSASRVKPAAKTSPVHPDLQPDLQPDPKVETNP